MRYYIGVDWADQTHAVWVVDEHGTKITARTVPHTAEGLSEWGRELDEWRAQGIERWAAIERPDGRVVDFLFDQLGQTNTVPARLLGLVKRAVPQTLRDRPLAVNIGEMFVCARKQ